MRKAQFVRQLDLVAAPDTKAGRGPFADAVQRQDRRFFEGRREESARRRGTRDAR